MYSPSCCTSPMLIRGTSRATGPSSADPGRAPAPAPPPLDAAADSCYAPRPGPGATNESCCGKRSEWMGMGWLFIDVSYQ